MRGQSRLGPTAAPSSFFSERDLARKYLDSISSSFSAKIGVSYDRALELQMESVQNAAERVARESALAAAKEEAKRAAEQGEGFGAFCFVLYFVSRNPIRLAALRHELAVVQDLARTQRGQLQRLAQQQSEQLVSSSSQVSSPSLTNVSESESAPPEGHYSVKVALLGEREDLTAKWEQEERNRVNKRIEEAERLAEHWHGQYLAIAMEAESTTNSRKEMAKAKEDLQVGFCALFRFGVSHVGFWCFAGSSGSVSGRKRGVASRISRAAVAAERSRHQTKRVHRAKGQRNQFAVGSAHQMRSVRELEYAAVAAFSRKWKTLSVWQSSVRSQLRASGQEIAVKRRMFVDFEKSVHKDHTCI